uniref:Uncharacterized protein n=1 Tax=Ananas comosus var. bracteatus TaxID=296719 RepID=A0A6V7Q0U6_ANACO|nr:unnamed protein product [Ananas comosus var. bracteatus]
MGGWRLTRSAGGSVPDGVRGGVRAVHGGGGAARGAAVTVPAWFRVLHLWWVFAPEVFDWCFRVLYIAPPAGDAPVKTMLDLSGAKAVLYPSSSHSPDIKNDNKAVFLKKFEACVFANSRCCIKE